jgi:acetoin utilization protein AcuB
MFSLRGIRRAPVLRGEKLVGMVSEGDLLRVLPSTVEALNTAEGHLAERRPVSAIMTHDPCVVGPDTHIEDAARCMLERKIGGMPVVHAGEVIGMVTESDLFRALIEALGGERGIRLTVMPPQSEEADAPDPDIAAICVQLSLRLVTLLTHSTPGGAPMVTLRAEGTRASQLPEALSDAGYRIVEISASAPAKAA